ncbi:hypothetical protein PSAC2689_170145 [Paraburkholderia sacchari]
MPANRRICPPRYVRPKRSQCQSISTPALKILMVPALYGATADEAALQLLLKERSCVLSHEDDKSGNARIKYARRIGMNEQRGSERMARRSRIDLQPRRSGEGWAP